MTSAPTVVALSGGVDSAVAAAHLVDQGHDVVGITMRLFNARGTAVSSGGRCCGPRDIEDARRVCDHLGIPFYVVDFAADFERDVIDDFTRAYLAGETPNPCVRCNQHIKFTPLLQRARALGAETLVTGHYAILEERDGAISLRRGRDREKDQSYFLFSMPIDELSSVRFPLGELNKDETRDYARRVGLPNADKRDSQEICFVPDGDYAGFVERRALKRGLEVPREGDIVDERGTVVGKHRGIHRYTVGQRRGLGNILGGRPAYVVRVDRDKNHVVVGERDSARQASFDAIDVRWLRPAAEETVECTVQVRHRAEPVACRVTSQSSRARVELDEGTVVAPGQAAVFYRGDEVLGGGWIAPT